MNDLYRLDRRISDVEQLLRRFSVDPNTGRITLSNVFNIGAKVSKDVTDKVIESDELKLIEDRNRKNKERVAKERAKKNKEVLKDYRIKS